MRGGALSSYYVIPLCRRRLSPTLWRVRPVLFRPFRYLVYIGGLSSLLRLPWSHCPINFTGDLTSPLLLSTSKMTITASPSFNVLSDTKPDDQSLPAFMVSTTRGFLPRAEPVVELPHDFDSLESILSR